MNPEITQMSRSAARIAMSHIRVLAHVIEAGGRRVGTLEIQAKLAEAGHHVCLRTIQRYLAMLQSEGAPIDNDGCSPQGWFLKKSMTAGEKALSEAVGLMRRTA